MTVRQVINLAKSSELSGLNVANNDSYVLDYINLGMLELHKRFPIKIEEHLIELVGGTDIYTMPADFMWIIAAYGEVPITSTDSVNVLPINEEDNPLSINTVGWNKLQVPLSVTGAYISIIYVASPTMYTLDDVDSEMDIPPQLLEPLLAYVGYKANASIDSGVQSEDSMWYIRFENSCNKIEQRSMLNSDDMFMNKRIDTRGFV